MISLFSSFLVYIMHHLSLGAPFPQNLKII